MDQENEFKSVANQLVGKVETEIQSLNQNRAQQQSAMGGQQGQVTELVEPTKKLIYRCNNSSRELKNRQSVFCQQFAHMQKWKSEAEKEILTARQCQGGLVNRATSKQAGNQVIEEVLRAMQVQNRNMDGAQNGRGESKNVFGGEANMIGGGSGSESTKVPEKEYSFDGHVFATTNSPAPTRYQINNDANDQKCDWRYRRI